jgi:hypothetical protein
VRRKTIDGRRWTDARTHARSSFVVGRKKKNTHHQGTKGTKGKRCKPQAQRSRRKEGCGLWIIRPCFRPSLVRVVPGRRENFRVRGSRTGGQRERGQQTSASLPAKVFPRKPESFSAPPRPRGSPFRGPSGSEERRRREEGAKISEKVRKLESERVKDAHQCAVIALVDLLTFLPSNLQSAGARKHRGPPTNDDRARIRASVNRRPSTVYRLPSAVRRRLCSLIYHPSSLICLWCLGALVVNVFPPWPPCEKGS